MTPGRQDPDLADPERDAALCAALSHAPDQLLQPPAAVRQALQQAARQAAAVARTAAATVPATAQARVTAPAAIASRWRQGGARVLAWLAQGLRPAALGSLASVAVAGLALHLWLAREDAPADAPGASTAAVPAATRQPDPRPTVAAAAPPPAAPMATAPPAPATVAATAVDGPGDPATKPAPAREAAAPPTPPRGEIQARAAPAPAETRSVSVAPASASTAPLAAEGVDAADPAADRARSAAAQAKAVVADAQSPPAASLPALAAQPLGRAFAGVPAAAPAMRAGVTPPALLRLADALRDPAAMSGWTVAEPGGPTRPMDDSLQAWWRHLIRSSSGTWEALAADAGVSALAGATGSPGWAVTAPDGSRFTLQQAAAAWVLGAAAGGDASAARGPTVWIAPRPGGRAASTAP